MRRVVDVDVPSGYHLEVHDYGPAGFGGRLIAPDGTPQGKVVCLTTGQPTASAAVESATTWLIARGLSNVATALRANAAAEIIQ
jgi:hypothetical protein